MASNDTPAIKQIILHAMKMIYRYLFSLHEGGPGTKNSFKLNFKATRLQIHVNFHKNFGIVFESKIL
jgi:hypothetical protein